MIKVSVMDPNTPGARVDSVEAFQAGIGPPMQEIMADVPNHTDQAPVIQSREGVVGQP